MRIVYIAGRYTAPTLRGVVRNIDEATKVALMLAERRIPFLCTILQTAHFELRLGSRDPGYEYWIDCSLEVLKRCDAVFLVPNWKESKGAQKEVEFARAHDMPVFEDIETLADWASQPV